MNKFSITSGSEYHNNLTSHLGAGVIFVDANKNIVHWNSWFAEHSNLDLVDYQDANLFNVFFALKNTDIEDAIEKSMSSGIPTLLPNTNQNSLFPLYNLSSEFKNNSAENRLLQSVNIDKMIIGDVHYCMITISDITDSVGGNQNLNVRDTNGLNAFTSQQNNTMNYQAIVKNMMDGFIIIDSKGNIMSINLAAADLLQYSESELVGENINLFFRVDDKTSDSVNITDQFQNRFTCSMLTKGDNSLAIELSISKILMDETKFFSILMREVS